MYSSEDSAPGTLSKFLRRLRYGRPIVIVSGLPRAGTSMMMQMLQAGGLELVTDARRAPDANNPRGYFELEAVKALETGAPPDWLAGARGKAVKIVSPLLRWLPDSYDYRVVFMQRDLDEVIASQNRMLADRGAPQDEGQNERIKRLYREHGEETMRILDAGRSFSTLVVDHHQAILHPEETARRVNRFLGGGLDVVRMAGVTEPALYLHRRRRGTQLPSGTLPL